MRGGLAKPRLTEFASTLDGESVPPDRVVSQTFCKLGCLPGISARLLPPFHFHRQSGQSAQGVHKLGKVSQSFGLSPDLIHFRHRRFVLTEKSVTAGPRGHEGKDDVHSGRVPGLPDAEVNERPHSLLIDCKGGQPGPPREGLQGQIRVTGLAGSLENLGVNLLGFGQISLCFENPCLAMHDELLDSVRCGRDGTRPVQRSLGILELLEPTIRFDHRKKAFGLGSGVLSALGGRGLETGNHLRPLGMDTE